MPYVPHRPWCATARYPGLGQFTFGTVAMPTSAKQHEVEVALIALALTVLPTAPEIIAVQCGSITFQPEDPQI
jgi:hypothetical protein